MKKIKSQRVVLLILFLIFSPLWIYGKTPENRFNKNQHTTIVIAAGLRDGLYYQIANGIQKSIQNDFPNIVVEVVPTRGSSENLSFIQEGIADLAIVQRDVLMSAYYHKTKPFREFEIVLPLMPEAVQIMAQPIRSGQKILPFSHLLQEIYKNPSIKIAIAPEGSGANITVRKIFILFGIPMYSSIYLPLTFTESIQLFNKGEIQFFAGVWGVPFEYLDTLHTKAIIGFNSSEINRIKLHMPNLDEMIIPADSYKNISIPTPTVATWAFLIIRKDWVEMMTTSVDKISFVQTILKNINKYPELKPIKMTYIDSDIFSISKNSDGTFHIELLYQPEKLFFRGLPLNSDLKKSMGRDKNLSNIAIIFLLFFIFLFSYHILKKHEIIKTKSIKKKKNWLDLIKFFLLEHKRAIIAGLLALLLFLPMGLLLQYFEFQFYQQNLVRSPITDFSYIELIQWLFVFALTSYEQDIFPLSVGGQVVATITSFLGWAALIFAVFFEFIAVQRRKQRRLGMSTTRMKNHIVICGCNDRLPKLLIKAVSAEKSFIKKHQRKYLVLDTRFKTYIDDNEKIKQLIDVGILDYVNGEAKNEDALKRARVDEAYGVILLADDRSREADEKTLLRALSISRYCREKNGQPGLDAIYIIAEINNEEFQNDLIKADVNEVICSSDMTEDVIIQSSFNHGISEILRELLKYDQFNEIYEVEVADYPHLAGSKFDDLLNKFRNNYLLLLGIKVVFKDNGKEIIDIDVIAEHLKQLNLKRHIILNPLDETEKNYRIKEDDQLFVMAQDEKQIKKALQKVSEL